MRLESDAFEDGGRIPAKYTCDGENISPPLHISEVPEGTETLALVMDDPDAPMGTFDHWLVWNIPADTEKIAEGRQQRGFPVAMTLRSWNTGGLVRRQAPILTVLSYIPSIVNWISKKGLRKINCNLQRRTMYWR